MRQLGLVTGLTFALALNACSSSNGGGPVDGAADAGTDTVTDAAPADTGAIKVTVAGTAAPHPLTARVGMNPASDFSELTVAVVDPSVVILSPTAPPLAQAALDTSPANCNAITGCAWSLDNADISKITLGLVGIIDDTRTPAASRLWVKTGTGAGTGAFILSVQMNPAPITGRPLFAVSKATEAKLAMFAAAFIPEPAIAPGTLEARGFMLGTVVGKLSAGALPVAGATVTVPPTETRLSILYPNDDFTGVGTSTASHGTILVVRKAATPLTSVVATWTIAGPGGTWTNLTAGTSPGTAFVLLMAQDE
jgi:hypothetical protein